MKIVVVGAGAMGSIYAAYFARSGHEVWAVDLWQDHVNEINQKGMQVLGPNDQIMVQGIKACVSVDQAGQADLFVIATKASAVASVAQQLLPYLKPESLVTTIQNGIGSAEILSQAIPVKHLVLGVADGFGARLEGPGQVKHAAMKLIRLGRFSKGIDEELERLVALWADAGFKVQAYEDIDQLIWEKFICNVTFSGPCSLFQCPLGELMADPARWLIALECMEEAYRIGCQLGVAFSFDNPKRYVTEFGKMMQHAKPSMLQDHERKIRSELPAINGKVVELGLRYKIPTPYNHVVCAALAKKESFF